MAWKEPLSKLAPQLGLSDVGLAKILDRLKVPRPGAGYWINKSHGKAGARPKLPEARYGDETSVRIVPKQAGTPEVEVAPPPTIVVPKRLSKPHRLVRATTEALAGHRPDKYGRVWAHGVLDIRVGQDSFRRALRLMDTAIKTLEKRGHGVMIRGERYREDTCAIVYGQHIGFALREASRQKAHEPTSDELRYEKKYGRHWGPQHDYSPTGVLTLSIEGWLGDRGLRSRWRDSRRCRLEDQLGEFIVNIEAGAKLHRKREEEEEERRRVEAEARARREAEEERRRREAEREAHLVELAAQWRSATDVREFLSALERDHRSIDGVEEVLVWGRQVADRIDPLNRAAEIRTELDRDSKKKPLHRSLT